MESNSTITASDIEVVSGGSVGEETTIRGTINLTSDFTSDAFNNTGDYAWAAMNVFGKHYILSPYWQLLEYKSQRNFRGDRRRGEPAHASINWDCVVEFTFTPEYAGEHLVSLIGLVRNNYKLNNVFKNYETKYQYFLRKFTILPAEVNPDDFEVSINGVPNYYEWDNLRLGEEVNQTEGAVTVKIPSGTMIIGTGCLKLSYDGNVVTIIEPQDAIFSDYVEVLVNEQPHLGFSEIVGGVPH